MGRAEYDKKRYAKLRPLRLAQMRAYRKRHRAKLAKLERARRKRIGGAAIRAAARRRYWRNPAYFKEKMIAYRYRGVARPTRPKPTKCEACGRKEKGRRLHVDHAHRSRRFRGWLCSNCNTGLGLLGDNAAGLKRALRYLEKNR